MMAMFCVCTGQSPDVYLDLTALEVTAFMEAADKYRSPRLM